MKDFTIKGYEFRELTGENKDIARNFLLYDIDILEDYKEDLSDYLLQHAKGIFPESEIDVQYSLSHCQGGGVNVYGNFLLSEVAAYVEKSLPRGVDADTYFTIPYNMRYGYCMASVASADGVDFLDNEDCIVEPSEHQQTMLDDLLAAFIEKMKELCGNMEQYGYDRLDELGGDDNLQSICELNEWYFTKDGKLIRD